MKFAASSHRVGNFVVSGNQDVASTNNILIQRVWLAYIASITVNHTDFKKYSLKYLAVK